MLRKGKGVGTQSRCIGPSLLVSAKICPKMTVTKFDQTMEDTFTTSLRLGAHYSSHTAYRMFVKLQYCYYGLDSNNL